MQFFFFSSTETYNRTEFMLSLVSEGRVEKAESCDSLWRCRNQFKKICQESFPQISANIGSKKLC